MKTLPAILSFLICLPVARAALGQDTASPVATDATTPAPSSTDATPAALTAQPAPIAPETVVVPTTTAPSPAPITVAPNAPSASASTAPIEDTSVEDTPPHHRIHDGFYLSGSIGGGARSATILGSQKLTVDGTGAGASFHIGGAVAPNLILHGTVSTSLADDPEFSVGSMTVVADNARLVFGAAGPGATYYVMPANLYIGASVLMAQTSIEIDDQEVAKTEWGAGVLLRAGKDFWIADRMLMGVGLEAFAANMSDQNTTDEVEARAFNLVVNLAYD